MLPMRSLPPQFLLPAWSRQQLVYAMRRAHKSDNTRPRREALVSHTTKWRQTKAFKKPLDSEATIRPTTKSHELRPITYQSRTKQLEDGSPATEESQSKTTARSDTEPRDGSSLSLFDELFPEEQFARKEKEKAAEKRLYRLPAFNWKAPKEPVGHEGIKNTEKELRQKKDQHQSIPQRNSSQRQDIGSGLASRRPKEQYAPKKTPERVSVLELTSCGKALEESDFFRLGPKGQHIDGWTSGILKVIPARDNFTLEPLGSYLILFSSDSAALAYRDKAHRLCQLSRMRLAWETLNISPPPGHLEPGEDILTSTQGFSLVPAYGNLSLELLHPPYKKRVTALLRDGGLGAIIAKKSNFEHVVLFSVDIGNIGQWEVYKAIFDDGHRRNLHWKTVERPEDISTVNDMFVEGSVRPGEVLGEEGSDSKRPSVRRQPKYIIPFEDIQEARRFVREWHYRPFPAQQGCNIGEGEAKKSDLGEPHLIVHAEIVW